MYPTNYGNPFMSNQYPFNPAAWASMNNIGGWQGQGLAPNVQEFYSGLSGGTRRLIQPDAEYNRTAEAPEGAPVVPTSVSNGMLKPASFIYTIDTTGAHDPNNPNAKVPVILYDQSGFFRATNNDIVLDNRVTIAVNGNERLYGPHNHRFCTETAHFAGFKVTVSEEHDGDCCCSGGGGLARQFNIPMKIHKCNEDTCITSNVFFNEIASPSAFNQNLGIIPLRGTDQRVDAHTAWEFELYTNQIVTIQPYVMLYEVGY